MIRHSLMWIVSVTLVGWLLIASAVSLRAALPEGDYLAYNAWKFAGQKIYLLDVNRGLAQSVTSQPVQAGPPVWSPDGRYLAFESRFRGGSSIFIVDAFGGKMHMLTPEQAGNQYTPVWFHDSRGLYFRNVPGEAAPAYRVNLDGSHLEPIDIINYEYLIPRRFDPANPIISGHHNGAAGIFLVRNGRDFEQLVTTGIAAQEHPQRSPDQQRIALIGCCDRFTEIYLMNADGSQFRQITRDGLHKFNLSWRP